MPANREIANKGTAGYQLGLGQKEIPPNLTFFQAGSLIHFGDTTALLLEPCSAIFTGQAIENTGEFVTQSVLRIQIGKRRLTKSVGTVFQAYYSN